MSIGERGGCILKSKSKLESEVESESEISSGVMCRTSESVSVCDSFIECME